MERPAAAARYSARGGTVEASLDPAPGGIVLRVADRGAGIAAEEIGRVFERFYRSENAMVHYAEGSGLGLPVAKAIVDVREGEIVLANRSGGGTIVEVRLPASGTLQAVA